MTPERPAVAPGLSVPVAADATALAAMAQRSFIATFGADRYPPADLAAFLDGAMGTATYVRQIADPAYALRIARNREGAIIGFIKLGPNDLPMPAGEPPLATTIELHQLYLLAEAQGTGIANEMMVWADTEARARGAVAIYLSVFIENIRAQRFYARHGYVEIGRNPFMVGNVVDDDRVWRKWL